MNPRSRDETACDAVMEAVAAAEGVDPVEITEQLWDVIDPDQLNAICDTGSVYVSFEYHGYHVTIDSEHTVDLTDPY